jgi:nucleotide-binding universal stress UspA family protein
VPAIQTILVPLDFSAHSDHALDVALDWARALEAGRVVLVHVHQPLHIPTPLPGSGPTAPELEARIMEDARLAIAERARRVEEAGLTVECEVTLGDPSEEICKAAKARAADLIVMGTRGRTGLAHLLLGSVAQRTLGRAPCPVLTVHREDDD